MSEEGQKTELHLDGKETSAFFLNISMWGTSFNTKNHVISNKTKRQNKRVGLLPHEELSREGIKLKRWREETRSHCQLKVISDNAKKKWILQEIPGNCEVALEFSIIKFLNITALKVIPICDNIRVIISPLLPEACQHSYMNREAKKSSTSGQSSRTRQHTSTLWLVIFFPFLHHNIFIDE